MTEASRDRIARPSTGPDQSGLAPGRRQCGEGLSARVSRDDAASLKTTPAGSLGGNPRGERIARLFSSATSLLPTRRCRRPLQVRRLLQEGPTEKLLIDFLSDQVFGLDGLINLAN